MQPGSYYKFGGGVQTTPNLTLSSTINPSTVTAANPTPYYLGTGGFQIPTTAAAVTQSLNASAGFDPMTNAGGTNPTINLYEGVLPGIVVQGTVTTLPTNYKWKIPTVTAPTPGRATQFIWVCLRRPANPFAPVSATNPMLVVDAMRVPYIDGTGATITTDTNTPPNPATSGSYNTIYSAQRFQPYRGGHAVPAAQGTPTPPATAYDTRYGYSEQIVQPSFANSGALDTQGVYFTNPTATPVLNNRATMSMYHTMGWANEYEMGSAMTAANAIENWDYLPFHDRDFTSVAELMFVPACPPGLFTKQFAEFAPSQMNVTQFFSVVAPQLYPGVVPVPPPATPAHTAFVGTPPTTPPLSFKVSPAPPVVNNFGLAPGKLSPTPPATPDYTMSSAPLGSVSRTVAGGVGGAVTLNQPVQPHSFPYLSDKFYYTGFGAFPTNDVTATTVGGYASDGWFKMFEFFEVPSQMIGAIGPVANGTNFDWARQDFKPGLLNLNLIVDEEVYFSLLGKQSITQQNGQSVDATGAPKTVAPSDQFNQQHLNSNQICLWARCQWVRIRFTETL